MLYLYHPGPSNGHFENFKQKLGLLAEDVEFPDAIDYVNTIGPQVQNVVESSPAGVFDRAAIKAVRKFLYQPPTYNGTSVKVNNVQIDLTFRLAN